jgi:hypothetical protein
MRIITSQRRRLLNSSTRVILPVPRPGVKRRSQAGGTRVIDNSQMTINVPAGSLHVGWTVTMNGRQWRVAEVSPDGGRATLCPIDVIEVPPGAKTEPRGNRAQRRAEQRRAKRCRR